jgi:protocatechuate 3,4-dioxygenase beta subunit
MTRHIDTDDDDRPIGRILTRRETLALIGATGLVACAPAVLSGATPTASTAPTGAATASSAATNATAATGGAVAIPSCIVRPAVTEGPYFVDEKLNRSDIRSDPGNGAVKPGAALALTFNVSRVSGASCAALANAQVDIWHCDALGIYSDATDPSFNTKGQKFLRGYQLTDATGKAAFTSIYPGWYGGRAVHIHFKIRTNNASGSGVADFTSQLFFDDALNAQVFATAPYSQKGSSGWMKNAQDGIYTGGGDKLLLKATSSGSGYAATFDIGLA